MSRSHRVPMLDLGREHRALESEIREVLGRILATSAFIGGEEVEAFEAEWAAYVGARDCVAVANGTDALALGLRALGVGPGDLVLTSPFTFAASVEAIDLVGATPIFADIDARDFTLDADAVAAVLERERVRAIIVVHLFGHPADLERLLPLARGHGVAVVEDAAQAHGARLRLGDRIQRVGSAGEVAAFSFYPSKNLGALGDAGAVTTNDTRLAERLRLLRNHGQVRRNVHVLRGATNSRMDALQAGVLRLKLERLDASNTARREAAARYAELLAGMAVVVPGEREGAESVYHQYGVRVRGRDRVRKGLEARGIETAVYYPQILPLQPAYAELGFGAGSFPVAEGCAGEILCLPISPGIAPNEQERVAAALGEALEPGG